jgi:putative FmdB family regulatory protein
MPIYEYACTNCGERTEARQSFTDPPLEECPICGGKLRKLYSPVGVVFKGTGFYATDARKSASSTGSGDSKSETKTEGKSETKSEPKPGGETKSSSSSSSSSKSD